MTDTWLAIPDGSPFPFANLPYGIFSIADRPRRVGVAIGDHVLDLAGVLDDGVFAHPSLNAFMARGPAEWRRGRERIQELLSGPRNHDFAVRHLVPIAEVLLHLPIEVGDYVDFYSSIHHAQNLGRIFRPGGDGLPANWRTQPLGYHGRSGTIVVSGTPIVRPCGPRGSRPAAAGEAATYGPSQRLDFEAEVGFVVGIGSTMGCPVPTEAFADHVFGAVLINDWSARDFQAWESVPLGPFLAKSFATSMSPWVVSLDALDAARVPPPAQDPAPLAYLLDGEDWGLEIGLEVTLNGSIVSRPPFATMYWTPSQQLAHLTANGACVGTGDLYASGTVSGPVRSEWGSLIELTNDGTTTVHLGDGSSRTFLEDGDTVTITATAPVLGGGRIGFGEVTGTIQPNRSTGPAVGAGRGG